MRAPFVRGASVVLVLIAVAAATGCGSKPPPSTYKAGAVPGISVSRLETLLGKPKNTLPFTLPGIQAEILEYPFGQAVARSGEVIAVTIAGDPSYTGPFNIRIGTSEDDLNTALRGAGGKRTGHRDSYELIVGDTVTRTKDVYDDTDHVMFELAAGNPNDPEVSYSVVSINLAGPEGFAFLQAVTNAKVGGMYPGQRIDNFTSEPWSA